MKPLHLLVLGAFVNSLGTGMTAFAIGVHMYAVHKSATAVALAQLCAFAPVVLLAPVAGVMADRHDRRLMMAIGDGGSVLGLALVAAALLTQAPSWLILVGVTASSVFAALTEPALKASVSDLVSQDEYVRASGLFSLAAAAKFLLAPIAAAFLVGVVGTVGIVTIDAATCLVTVGISLYVRQLVGTRLSRRDRGVLAELREGWQAVVGNTPVRTAVMLIGMVTVATGTVQTLLKPILLPIASVETVGTVETVAAIGLLLGSALLAPLGSMRPTTLLTLGLVGMGVAMAAFALRPDPVWIGAVGLALFLVLPICNAGAEALVRSRLHVDVQARAWGLISPLSQAGYLMAFVAAGPLADRVMEPLMAQGGSWADSIGVVMGTGAGRGSAVLVTIMGLSVIAVGVGSHLLRGVLDPTGETDDGVATGGAPAPHQAASDKAVAPC
ncbi:MFS transporter [Schaalia sp. 19OD2882]|uniref:MFS transporter n=1 Tax=Schaalia sp. 19OD2882 TaxID=2794089 RepID=UPI001C1ECC67|nr:MFS transporter [Schaalia sp. 19OD2882]QWW19074.1 MFS transporter [Schaalia sp. 19OD2882]